MTACPVALLIPTVHHRAPLFRRALRHLSASRFAGPVVVSDHSPQHQRSAVAAAVAQHGELDITLLAHPPELHFLGRLAACARAVRTPYVHLHADDDFLVVPLLEKLAGRLDRDPGCAAAMGINVNASLKTWELLPLRKHAIEDAQPFDRLLAQLEAYSSALYALRRREELADTFDFAAARCPDVQFWQYLESCVAALDGRLAVLPELHYVRGIHEAKWSTTLVRERSPDHFPQLILQPHFHPRLAAFRAALVEACAARKAVVNSAALDDGLIHLLNRGLATMGLPARRTAAGEGAAHEAVLQAQLADPASAAAGAMRRIFELEAATRQDSMGTR